MNSRGSAHLSLPGLILSVLFGTTIAATRWNTIVDFDVAESHRRQDAVD